MRPDPRWRPPDFFEDWKRREALAEAMIPLIGQLYRRNIEVDIYGTPLINISVLDIMQALRAIRQVEHNELSEFETHAALEALVEITPLGSAHIDIGRIVVKGMDAGILRKGGGDKDKVREFIRSEVAELIGSDVKPLEKPQDIVLFGFGRIGRLLARLLLEKTGSGDNLRLRAIVVRGGPEGLHKRVSLLRRDSVHGRFRGTIRVLEDKQTLVANGNEIRVIYASAPDEVDYTDYGIDGAIIVDNVGKWATREGLARHLKCPGASKVLLTAAGKDIKNVVHGVNHGLIEGDDNIIAAASCTTNAIVPVLRAINEEYGVRRGHIETIHAYTNDQNLIDNYHKANRRGRSAPLNMVLTTTGAARAVTKILPEMEGKLTASAIRVPVPDVSMAILHLDLKQTNGVPATASDINEYMRKIALHSRYRRQISYSHSSEVVSSDFIGSRYACVFDSQATLVNGDQCTLYLWYDNEFGYSCQVHRVLEVMAGVKFRVCPSVVE